MVPINAARVAAGADSLQELVEDPRTGEICRRCDTLDAREKRWQSARAAKKRAYAATLDEQARAARALEEQARAEARALEEQARAEALALAARAATAPLTEEETSAVLRAGGRAADLVRRGAEARATDEALRAEGDAAKVLTRQRNRGHAATSRKRKKLVVEALAREEAGLMERAAGLLVDLGRGGSKVLDDEGAVEPLDMEPFREDEEALQDLVDAKDRGEVDDEVVRKKRKALGMRYTRARQALAAKALQRRVALLEIRVAELEEELRARAAA